MACHLCSGHCHGRVVCDPCWIGEGRCQPVPWCECLRNLLPRIPNPRPSVEPSGDTNRGDPT